ncbi:MAG: HAD hydrolase-like protein [Myxococcales bacterium]|nr:HAD hydrolase-like protein [Myxococcales bacterium]MDD9965201.1 HAD hydrolase-like protein [Myxococcales bacterium]
MSISTLIFDFDGTIADSFYAVLDVANSLAPEFHYRTVDRSEVPQMRGLSYRELRDRIGVSWHRIPMVAARIRREMEGQVPKLPVIDGMQPTLHELHKHVKLGILTSNTRKNVNDFLAAHDLEVFDFVGTASNVWGKGRRLRALLRSKGLTPGEVAYVGDEVRDIEATRSASVRMIAVAWGYSGRGLLEAHDPDHLVDVPADLVEVVKELQAPEQASTQGQAH